jgi:hypothetical protein
MSEKALAKALLRRHPEYDDRLEHWEFLRVCYDGGREWFDQNLFQYWKEGEEEYEARKSRAYRFNHSREVVDLVNKYLFRTQIARGVDNVPQSVIRFWMQTTKDGMDIDYFMRNVSKQASIMGRVYIVVDSTNQIAGPISVADARRAGIRNFAYIVNPIDAVDMSFDENDELNWILIRETYRDDSDFENSSGDVEERLRLWTRTGWVLYQLSEYKQGDEVPVDVIVTEVDSYRYTVTKLGEGTHGLGRVPVIVHDHVEHYSDYYAPSLINDIAYQDRAVANYLSNLDAIIQDQTFSQLAIPAQALMPGEEEQTKNKLIEMGTKRIFLYNAEAGVAPEFLSPDPKQVDVIITAIRQVINEIYHSVGMAGERTKQDNSMGIDNSSGVAKAYDFERINALLSTKAHSLESAEQEIVELVMMWNGDTVASDTDRSKWVKYSDTFDVRGLVDEFDMAAKLQKISAPAIIRRIQMSKLVDKMLPVISDAERAEIDKELMEWPESVEEMLESPSDSDSDSDDLGDSQEPTQGAVQPEPLGTTADPERE